MADDGPGRPGNGNPSVEDLHVAHLLRQFREGLSRPPSCERVAQDLGWSPTKMSRYETGKTGYTRTGLTAILGYYTARHGMTAEQARLISSVFEKALETAGLAHPYLGPAVVAASVRVWAPLHVPRLLQLPRYAEAVLRDMQQVTRVSPGGILSTVSAVGTWQQRLAEQPPGLLHALLDESVLYRLAGDPGVMREQLAFLEHAAADGGNSIQVRVLPLAAAAPRWVPAFSYLEYQALPGSDLSAEVITDELEGTVRPRLPESQAWLRLLLFGQLWDAADEAGPVIKRVLADTWA